MKITFDITDSEADIIASQYAYDSKINPDKADFVLEIFKKFGRDCIISQALHAALIIEEAAKIAAVDSAKSAISF